MMPIDTLLIGHSTADLVKGERVLGGTVSYAAPIVHLFGHRVGVLTSAAEDETLLESLRSVAELQIYPAEKTTTFENIYREGGRVQVVHGVAAPLTYEMLPVDWREATLVHLAPLVNEVDFAFASAFPNATVLLTPQGYMRQWGDDGHVKFKPFLDEGVLKHINILVLSKQDIAEAPELEYEFPKYTEHVVVTDGEHGGNYYHKGEVHRYKPYPVTEIDPTGAGDVFAASLLSSLPLLNYNMHAALKVAAKLAALAVTVLGSSPAFTADDVQLAIQEAKND
jgi:sugar/nucleoside kinase (ribokinase family)